MTGGLVLLDLIWPRGNPPVDPASLDWQAIDRSAGQHRLRPLLHHRAGTIVPGAPPDVRAGWHRAYRRSALRALQQHAELARIGQVLAQAGIAAIVLKGGGFVWRGWFNPALRPMRDLDILVDEADLALAQQVLGDRAQFSPLPGHRPDHKHAPPLRSPRGVTVELHKRLIDTATAAERAREAEWRRGACARSQAFSGLPAGITAFADTDALLHIIAHAALDHRFNNGPLLIGDIAALVRHGSIDWAQLRAIAHVLGATRACALALALAAHWQADLPIAWTDAGADQPDAALVERAARTMLLDAARLSELGWAAQFADVRWQQWPAQALAMLRRRAQAGASQGDRPRLAALMRTTWSHAGTMLQPAARQHLRDSVAVTQWLAGGQD